MDIAALRAEIKSWEREFRHKHARDPTVHEIKAQPAIAAKYKLYKSLSKPAPSPPIPPSSATPGPIPVTPPRAQPSSSLLAKTRAVKVDPPVQTTNPFSPVKHKSRRVPGTAATDSRLALGPARPNPFTTPTKPKAPDKAKARPPAPRRSPSPDPFPLIQQPQLQPSLRAPSAEPTTAVTRARKRLRGEPVSPSPVKEKRARIFRALPGSSSGDDSSDGAAGADATFVGDTPVKPPVGGKSFRLLFDEVAPGTALKKSASRARSALPSLFADKKDRSQSRAISPTSSGDEGCDASKPSRLLGSGKKLVRQKSAAHTRLGVPRGHLPGRDDLWSDVGPSKGRAIKPEEAPARPAAKRALPDDESRSGDEMTSNENMFLRLPLLPPSPPPPDSYKTSSATYAAKNTKGKGKGTAASSRKKAKLLAEIDSQGEGEESEDDEDQEFDRVKIIEHTQYPRGKPGRDGEAEDSEPDWDWSSRATQDMEDFAGENAEPGSVEVRLPEDLKRMLALSPGRARESAEEESRLVQGLLYGRRARYDPGKGGEVWGAGEVVGGEEDEGLPGEGKSEEEWEGEGLPWEAGEL